eukprot:sb/3475075/
MKRRGPSTDPWITLLKTSSGLENFPSRATVWVLPVKKASIHSSSFPLTPRSVGDFPEYLANAASPNNNIIWDKAALFNLKSVYKIAHRNGWRSRKLLPRLTFDACYVAMHRERIDMDTRFRNRKKKRSRF